MRRVFAWTIVIFLFVFPSWAQSPNKPIQAGVNSLVLYDDFNGAGINPAKWDDNSNLVGMREVVRELSPSYQGQGNNRRLRLLQQAYSWTGNDAGSSYGGLGLRFTNPAAVTEMSVSVTVSNVAVSNCQSNADSSAVWAGVGGRFFNYGGQQDPNQDVEADISLIRDSWYASGPLRVQASYGTGDGIFQYQVLGSVYPGKTVTLRLKWDQPNHQFIFRLNNDPPVPLVYGSLPDIEPPYYALKTLSVTQGTPHCTSTPTGGAMMDAYFDNVFVDP
jgi:hypothetical protein